MLTLHLLISYSMLTNNVKAFISCTNYLKHWHNMCIAYIVSQREELTENVWTACVPMTSLPCVLTIGVCAKLVPELSVDGVVLVRRLHISSSSFSNTMLDLSETFSLIWLLNDVDRLHASSFDIQDFSEPYSLIEVTMPSL